MGGEFAFDADTRVAADGTGGGFTAALTGRWNGTAGAVNGGYMLAVCLRALAPAMPFPDPVVVSGFFRPSGRPASSFWMRFTDGRDADWH